MKEMNSLIKEEAAVGGSSYVFISVCPFPFLQAPSAETKENQ